MTPGLIKSGYGEWIGRLVWVCLCCHSWIWHHSREPRCLPKIWNKREWPLGEEKSIVVNERRLSRHVYISFMQLNYPLNVVTSISSKNDTIFTSLSYFWDSWYGGFVSTKTWGCRSDDAWGSLVKSFLCIVSLRTRVGFPDITDIAQGTYCSRLPRIGRQFKLS